MHNALFLKNKLFIALSVTLGAFPGISLAMQAPLSDIEHLEVAGQRPGDHQQLGSAERLLGKQGVDFSAAGGMAALPVLNGMMGDRIKILVDGADVSAACANQMNPPLSYVSASQIRSVSVVAGVSPVSLGGDNIAGVIKVSSLVPRFGQSDSVQWEQGSLSAGWRSISHSQTYSASASASSKDLSFEYRGAFEDAESYRDGHGNRVTDTLFRAQNHSWLAAWQDEGQTLALKLTHQYIPFEGFANQYMDMTDNKGYGAQLNYDRKLASEGEFSAQLNWHLVQHKMGFFSDEKPGKMPMETEGSDYSYQLAWRLPESDGDVWLWGHEFFNQRLDDTWPAVPGSMMMGPMDYVNIQDGLRRRVALYGEWQHNFSPRWWLSSGVRFEYVTTNTGEVQPYSRMPVMGMPNPDAAAASTFNSSYRKQSDALLDATVLARYQGGDNWQLELGLARKNRAPNLYERYSWGRGVMASTMVGWFGDGNGYVGDINLRPETAHTLSLAYSYAGEDMQLGAAAWYSDIRDYIDVEVIGSFSRGGTDGSRNLLQFTNLDARLYGANLYVNYRLSEGQSGRWSVEAEATALRGERKDGSEPLYQIKPLETRLALAHRLGDWQTALEWQWVATKDEVDSRRLENTTDSYSLLNLESRITWQSLTLTLALNNLLGHYYQLPLGGVSVADYRNNKDAGFAPLAGAGRSLELSASYRF
ncbi:TonB-dependent siderophore receptor [Shewanella amazonensis]|uniref:TonB-dependent receptor, putative n=1 Tax=Shewanella amazonensis (strain ATCC BAA-1098 / SB2B) TaxID=326297 RepID=A1SAM9_SHEAM|nr:TonB-dependent receptor [Shewanella amazonensis]ABM01436.1 TonB-dependent receptor, putative [Shewanella amazonensis SB2B]